MCDPSIGTTRWSPAKKIEMVWRSWCNGGGGDGVSSHNYVFTIHTEGAFVFFHGFMVQFDLVRHVLEFDSYTLICMAFKSHTEWINAQCVSAPTTTILLTTTDTLHDLNCFGHVCTRHRLVCTKILQNVWLVKLGAIHSFRQRIMKHIPIKIKNGCCCKLITKEQ